MNYAGCREALPAELLRCRSAVGRCDRCVPANAVIVQWLTVCAARAAQILMEILT